MSEWPGRRDVPCPKCGTVRSLRAYGPKENRLNHERPCRSCARTRARAVPANTRVCWRCGDVKKIQSYAGIVRMCLRCRRETETETRLQRYNYVRELRAEGMPARSIAKASGYSLSRVWKILRGAA